MDAPVHVFWFRRDLRLDDNAGLYHALRSGIAVLPVFIFDRDILDRLERDDARVSFIHRTLVDLDQELRTHGSGLVVRYGRPSEIWKELISSYDIRTVYTNHDYEPYALERDAEIGNFLKKKNIPFMTFKDQVIFEKDEVVKEDGSPYTVYTPYMKKWMSLLNASGVNPLPSERHLDGLANFLPVTMPSIESIGFSTSQIRVPEYDTDNQLISGYSKTRDYPFLEGTSRIGPFLRFGLVGIRKLVERVKAFEPTFINELIWREFFMMILWHFPEVESRSFRPAYDRLAWENNEEHFQKWCDGMTGYPIVDAGMRQLKATGTMHNRVRMITAGFLCKHLLTDWRLGEAWFARHLLDYELSSNNGNWQWAAGTGCDAAPYFRVFNPLLQQERYDPDLDYVRKWVPDYTSPEYPAPIVDHKTARERAIRRYREALA